jgi:2-oxoglutarate ferredoxin oxidoreductase subunit alpha
MKVGKLRLICAWPFPEKLIRDLAAKVKAFVVPELNMGQMAYEVERCAGGQARTIFVPHPGGTVHKPAEILAAIERGAK